MKEITITLKKQNGKVQPPKAPNACCYCASNAHETIQVERGGFKLNVPYCEEHLAPAKEYISTVLPKMDRLTLASRFLSAILLAFAAPAIFEPKKLFFIIVLAIVGLLVGFYIGNVPVDNRNRKILAKGAQELGFEGEFFVAPGIFSGSTTSQPDGSEQLQLSIMNETFANWFEKIQKLDQQEVDPK